MILIIDNYDSFTYNLSQQVATLGFEVLVRLNDQIALQEVADLAPSHIIISPGPGRPTENGISCQIIKRFHQEIPILGVCLGHQCIGVVFGSQIKQLERPLHGKTSAIQHTGTGLFQALPKPLRAARYHSLALESLPDEFELTAWADDGTIMGIEHKNYSLYGLQFHPESFMTPEGVQLMRNFLT